MPTRIEETRFLQGFAHRLRQLAVTAPLEFSNELLKLSGELDLRAAKLELDMIEDGVISEPLPRDRLES